MIERMRSGPYLVTLDLTRFQIVRIDIMTETTAQRDLDASAPEEAVLEQEERIVQWLLNYVADVLALPLGSIDAEASFQKLGLDSSAAVGMTGDLSDWLGRE